MQSFVVIVSLTLFSPLENSPVDSESAFSDRRQSFFELRPPNFQSGASIQPNTVFELKNFVAKGTLAAPTFMVKSN